MGVVGCEVAGTIGAEGVDEGEFLEEALEYAVELGGVRTRVGVGCGGGVAHRRRDDAGDDVYSSRAGVSGISCLPCLGGDDDE